MTTISSTYYPILKYLETKSLSQFLVSQHLSHDIKSTTSLLGSTQRFDFAQRFLNSFSNLDYKISCFPKTITPHINSVGKKLGKFMGDLPDANGLFLITAHLQAIFYRFDASQQRLIFISFFGNDVTSLGSMLYAGKPSLGGENTDNQVQRHFRFENLIPDLGDITSGPPSPQRQVAAITARNILEHLVFYCLVDTEIELISESQTFKRKASLNGEDFTTKSKLKIEMVDSSWFRVISQTPEFKGGGHFTLASMGNETNHSRKLIWNTTA